MKSLQLSQIWIYPVKSMSGIPVTSASVRPKGLEYDRRWMLIDEEGTFMTQRVHPKMALFKTSLSEDGLKIHFHTDTLNVPINTTEGAVIQSRVWNDPVVTQEVSPDHSRWVSERLGVSCRLVFFPEKNPRPVDPEYKIQDDHVSLADGYPFLIIGQASLDYLNSLLQHPLPINRFRPNFVFTGGEPHEEDTWRNFVIGGNKFAGVKPCSRCIMTTIDQDKGEKGVEPLPTLARYRKVNNKIQFGQNVIALEYGQVSVGDEITVHTRQPEAISI